MPADKGAGSGLNVRGPGGPLEATSPSDAQWVGASPVRQHLKRATADLHRRLETDLLLLDPDLSLDRYRRILGYFFGFYAPIEGGVARVASAVPGLGLPLRARTGLIESDLLSLGWSCREVAELPRCTELPPLSRPEELAGCLYVLEGACLGGRVIAPALRERLGVAADSGASFFIGAAERTPARWRVFLAWLEGLVQAGAPTAAIVASARATFLAFACWVERQPPARG
jgi:heme oxygenase